VRYGWVDLAVKAINFSQGFAVIDLEILAQGTDGRLRILGLDLGSDYDSTI